MLVVVQEAHLKSIWLSTLLIAGLQLSAATEPHICTQSVNGVSTPSACRTPGATQSSLASAPATPSSRDSNQSVNNQDDGTIVVNVWSSEEAAQKLSTSFAVAGLTAAGRMQNTERRMEQSIKRGFPLGEFWIRLDFDEIDDSLGVASLSARNDADRAALQQLQSQADRLRVWSNWLIQQNRELRLADYYISPAALDNDEQFQSSVACTNFLLSMMASGKVQEEDRSCR